VRVEVPEVPRITEDTLSETERPVDGTTEAARLTVPVKPFRLVTVIVEVSDAPSRTCRLVRLASTLKSTIRRLKEVAWGTPTDVPVIETEYVIAGVDEVVEQVRIELAETTVEEIATIAGFGVHVGPVGETNAARVTVPENPLTPVTVIIVEESEEPAGTVRDAWLADTVKSTRFTVRLVEFEISPEVPFTVTE